MKISFIIPAYNEEAILGDCLTCITDAISEIDVDTEILVVNNASTDTTAQVAAAFKNVKVVDQPRKGLVWARHAGYLASSGDLLANVDADTCMSKKWVLRVIQEFKNDPALLALSGPYYYYDAPWTIRVSTYLFYALGLFFDKASKFLFRKGSMLQGGNFVVRRTALEQIGGYDTSIEFYGEDTDIGRRLNTIGKVTWTFKLPMKSSGRRLMKEGIIKTAILYGVNFFWISFFGKPRDYTYTDIRPNEVRKNN